MSIDFVQTLEQVENLMIYILEYRDKKALSVDEIIECNRIWNNCQEIREFLIKKIKKEHEK